MIRAHQFMITMNATVIRHLSRGFSIFLGHTAHHCSLGQPALFPPPERLSSFRMVNFSFQPQSLTINVGDTVLWTNTTTTGHNVVSDTSAWTASPLFTRPGTFPVTFTEKGELRIFLLAAQRFWHDRHYCGAGGRESATNCCAHKSASRFDPRGPGHHRARCFRE